MTRIVVRAKGRPFCSRLTGGDRMMMARTLQRSVRDGNEHGFIRCPDGGFGPECVGDSCKVALRGYCHGGAFYQYHTHPANMGLEGVQYFSPQDILGAMESGADGTCVGYPLPGGGRNVRCATTAPSAVRPKELYEAEEAVAMHLYNAQYRNESPELAIAVIQLILKDIDRRAETCVIDLS